MLERIPFDPEGRWRVSGWNLPPEGRAVMGLPLRVISKDRTLREGEERMISKEISSKERGSA
jgi:hypothetical protein